MKIPISIILLSILFKIYGLPVLLLNDSAEDQLRKGYCGFIRISPFSHHFFPCTGDCHHSRANTPGRIEMEQRENPCKKKDCTPFWGTFAGKPEDARAAPAFLKNLRQRFTPGSKTWHFFLQPDVSSSWTSRSIWTILGVMNSVETHSSTRRWARSGGMDNLKQFNNMRVSTEPN